MDSDKLCSASVHADGAMYLYSFVMIIKLRRDSFRPIIYQS